MELSYYVRRFGIRGCVSIQDDWQIEKRWKYVIAKPGMYKHQT